MFKSLENLNDNDAGALITDPPYSSGGQFRSDRIKKTTAKYKGRTNKQYLEIQGDTKINALSVSGRRDGCLNAIEF